MISGTVPTTMENYEDIEKCVYFVDYTWCTDEERILPCKRGRRWLKMWH